MSKFIQRAFWVVIGLLIVSNDTLEVCNGQDMKKWFQDDPTNYSPSPKEMEVGKKLLATYGANIEGLSRFACAMFVDKTREDFVKPQNSSHTQDWYFHAFDSSKGLMRQDELVFHPNATVFSAKGLQPSVVDHAVTAFKTETDVIQVADALKNNSLTLKEAKDEDYLGFSPQAFTDPWAFPLYGSIDVVGQSSHKAWATSKRFSEVLRDDMRVVSAKKLGEITGVEIEFRRSDTPIYIRILFNSKLGDMPVRAEWIYRNPGEMPRVFSIVETDWGNHDRLWLPQTNEMEYLLPGPQKKIGIRFTHVTEFYWVLNKNVSDEVFNMTPPHVMRTEDLKHGILENAVNVP